MTDRGDLISLVTHPVGNGPHNIVLPLERFDSLPPIQESAAWGEDRLQVNGLEVDLSFAETWNAKPDWKRIRAGRAQIQNALPALVVLLRKRAPDPGIIRLLDGRSSGQQSIEAHFAEALIEPASTFISALQRTQSAAAIEGALGLAGLGSGFTPAGDDYICGAMLACWAGFVDADMRRDLPEIAQKAGQRTNRISAAYMHSAAVGEFGRVWHALLENLIRADTHQTSQVAAEIISIGHNSGAYTLTGFIQLVNKGRSEHGHSSGQDMNA
jgi:hypothetical protein